MKVTARVSFGGSSGSSESSGAGAKKILTWVGEQREEK